MIYGCHAAGRVKLMASQRGGYVWVRFSPPSEGELINRTAVIGRDPMFALRRYGRGQHWRHWWQR